MSSRRWSSFTLQISLNFFHFASLRSSSSLSIMYTYTHREIFNWSKLQRYWKRSLQLTELRPFLSIPFQIVFIFSHIHFLQGDGHKLRIEQIDSGGSTERTLFFSGINCWVFHKFVIGSRTMDLMGVGCFNEHHISLWEKSWHRCH